MLITPARDGLNRSLIVDITAEQVERELALGVPDRERGLDVPVPGRGREHQNAGVDRAQQPQVGQERYGRVEQAARIVLPGYGERRGGELVVDVVDHGAQAAVGDERDEGLIRTP